MEAVASKMRMAAAMGRSITCYTATLKRTFSTTEDATTEENAKIILNDLYTNKRDHLLREGLISCDKKNTRISMDDFAWWNLRVPRAQEHLIFEQMRSQMIFVDENLTKKAFRFIPELVRWQPPKEGYLKLNYDARSKEGEMMTWGAVLRDSNGNVLKTFSIKENVRLHSHQAEVKACQSSIKEAVDFLNSNPTLMPHGLIVKGDAEQVALRFNGRIRIKAPKEPYAASLDLLRRTFKTFDITKTSSEQNQMAHFLAMRAWNTDNVSDEKLQRIRNSDYEGKFKFSWEH